MSRTGPWLGLVALAAAAAVLFLSTRSTPPAPPAPEAPTLLRGAELLRETGHTFQRAEPVLRACYELGLADQPELEARWTVRIDLSPEGSVTGIDLQGSPKVEVIEQCLEAEIRQLAFPPAAKARTAQRSFRFGPTPPAAP